MKLDKKDVKDYVLRIASTVTAAVIISPSLWSLLFSVVAGVLVVFLFLHGRKSDRF